MTLQVLKDPKQRLRLGRNLQALLVTAAFTILCYFLMEFGYFRATWREFGQMVAICWVVYLCFPLLLVTGLNKKFSDPSLTMLQTIWSAFVIVISLYFVYRLRMVILLFSLLVMVFGAFRLRPMQFFYLTACFVLGYGLVIYLIDKTRVEIIDMRFETIQWAVYSLVACGCAFLGSMQSQLRSTVRHQNRRLVAAMKEARELATTDSLTGLYNRRHIMEVLEYHKALTERGEHNFVVIYADLDHFKTVNDRFGHSAGDQVLQRFGEVAHGTVRRVDFVSRFGGEEFVLVLVDSDIEQAGKVAERIRSATEELDLSDIAEGLHITVSLGVTAFQPGEDIDTMLIRADQALYQAKQEGRNRIVYMGRATEAQADSTL